MLVSEVLGLEEDLKARFIFEVLKHPLEIDVMIGLNVENPSVFQDPVTGVQEGLLKQSFFIVSLLRPWIWEEVEYGLDFAVAEHVLEALTPGAEVAEVPVLELVELGRKPVASLKAVIEADEIDVRVLLAVLQHELAVAGADLDLEGLLVLEDVFVPLSFVDLRFLVS